MWFLISLLSYHVFTTFAARNSLLLDSCNWINDPELNMMGRGSIYAISDTPYCNYQRYFDETTWEITDSSSWKYECISEDIVQRTHYYGSDNCVELGPEWTVIDEFNSTDADFNCAGASAEGTCLLQFETFAGIEGNDSSCDYPIWNVTSGETYNVNGGCFEWYSGYYAMVECNHCSVLDGSGNSAGFVIDLYANDLCEGDIYTTYPVSTYPECDWFPMTITSCNGVLDPKDISYPMVKDECTLTTCLTEVQDCSCDGNCSALFSYLFAEPCSSTQSDYESGLDYWCAQGINPITQGPVDCDTSGISPLLTCFHDNDCVYYTPESTGSGDDCDVCMDSYSACMVDTDCAWIFNSSLGQGDDWLDDLHAECEGRNCTLAKEFILCQFTCDPDEDWDSNSTECWDEIWTNSTDMFECMLDFDCYYAINGTFGNIFSDDNDDDTFFTPTSLTASKDVYCTDNPCPTAFQTFFDTWITCIRTECHFLYCEDDITVCEEDTTCYEELLFVTQIEDNYSPAKDDDLMVFIKDNYCAGRPGGQCTDLLNTAFTCVQNNSCLHLNDDQCWEQCQDKVTACADNGECMNALLEGVLDETECKDAVNDGRYPYSECDCDELSSIMPSDSDYGGYYGDYDSYYTDSPNTTWMFNGTCPASSDSDSNDDSDSDSDNYVWVDYYYNYSNVSNGTGGWIHLYDLCAPLCEACEDSVINAGVSLCGEGEACEDTYKDLLGCIVSMCDDDDEDDECSSLCWPEILDCKWNADCEADWEWVEWYTETQFGDNMTEPIYDIANCSVEYIEALWDRTFNGTNQNETSDIVESYYFQCKYYDIAAYCDVDGICPLSWWNQLNCFFGCHGVETMNVTTTTTTTTTTTSTTSTSTSSTISNTADTEEEVVAEETFPGSSSGRFGVVIGLSVMIATLGWI